MNDLILQYDREPIDRKYYVASKSYFSLNFYEYFSNFFLLLLKQKKQKIKLILLDLDDTLWGGTVSEIGWQKINLGGNNVSGELFKKFQESLLIIKNYGIPLGIVSKNNPETALQAINRHPEMILKSKDFIESEYFDTDYLVFSEDIVL
jgi:predicted enzyme involved in methoxymalonyl-ACP biosynthesis